MVFYLKYRPQKISELDSESVRVKLSSYLTAKDIPHAFLFSGPKGLGKTSAARILAKVVNCQKRKSGGEPCNICTQCKSITIGTNLDVIEIDAASNRGIDEIRDLREKIRLAPIAGNNKVYIIDEVHMLTMEAFNALLKTLEEPPAHVLFVLCTTDLHKVPQTIVSRCFHIEFAKASGKELERSLGRIIKEEKINIADEAIQSIANASDGSFRDASKVLELAVLQQGKKKITKETIDNLTGKSIQSIKFIEFLVQKDVQKALLWLNESVDNGLNVKFWIEEVLTTLHRSLLAFYNIEKEGNGEIKGVGEQELKKLIELFSRAHGELRTAVIPQLPAEIAIIEYCTEK